MTQFIFSLMESPAYVGPTEHGRVTLFEFPMKPRGLLPPRDLAMTGEDARGEAPPVYNTSESIEGHVLIH